MRVCAGFEKADTILNKIHEILQKNNIGNSERDRICYNFGHDIRTVIMRVIKKQMETRQSVIKELNELIKDQIYSETAKYETSQQ